MIPLLIAGGIFLLLCLLLLTPVHLEVGFRQEFTAQMRYLWFRFPFRSKEEESPAQEAPAEAGKGSSSKGLLQGLKAMLRREDLSGFLQSLQELVQALETASRKLLKKVRVKQFDLYVCLGGEEDAAEGAILYGQVCGIVYSACGLLFGLFPGGKKSVSVDLDYHSREHRVEFSGKASIRLLFLLIEGTILLYKALPFFKKLQTRSQSTERISQRRKQGEIK